MAPALRLRSRRDSFGMLTGVAVAMLTIGLALPFVLGESVEEPAASMAGQIDLGSERVPILDEPAPDGSTPPVAAALGDRVSLGPGITTPTGGGEGTAASPVPSAASPDPAPAEAGPVGAPLTATDQGVTATSVKLGILMLDIGQASRISGEAVFGISTEQQQAAFQSYVDEINDAGGIHGRRIEPVFRTFDVLSQDDMRAKCLELTQDEKVFAVIASGGFAGPPILCITEEHRTPLLNSGNSGTPTEYLHRSNGRLFTAYQHGNRHMLNWVAELHRVGALQGRKIGILSDDGTDPGDLTVGGGLLPALAQFGYEVTHRARLAGDLATGASQVPLAVREMRSKGVDAVLLASSQSSRFADDAGRQGWSPAWHGSDFAAIYADAQAQNFPDSFEGALLFTTSSGTSERDAEAVDAPEGEAARRCRETYEQRTGRTLDKRRGNEYGLTGENCTLVKLFAAGAKAAGPELTRDRFSAGMQSLGEVPLAMWGGGSYAPGKYDAADLISPKRWFRDCRCWRPAGPFRPSYA
jgi:hypothetical protein